MADLDDFFAKKDRKKSKSTKKFATTTEELVKKIEDTSARTKNESRPVVRKDIPAAGAPGQTTIAADGTEVPAEVAEQVSPRNLRSGRSQGAEKSKLGSSGFSLGA